MYKFASNKIFYNNIDRKIRLCQAFSATRTTSEWNMQAEPHLKVILQFIIAEGNIE